MLKYPLTTFYVLMETLGVCMILIHLVGLLEVTTRAEAIVEFIGILVWILFIMYIYPKTERWAIFEKNRNSNLR